MPDLQPRSLWYRRLKLALDRADREEPYLADPDGTIVVNIEDLREALMRVRPYA